MKMINKFVGCILVCSIIFRCVSSDTVKQNDRTTSSRTALSIYYLIDRIFMPPLSVNLENICDLQDNQTEVTTADESSPLPIKTFVDLYDEGIQAYLANDWEECADKLERSVNGYHDYYNAITSCRIECEYKRQRIEPLYDFDINNLQFFESIVRKTLCLEKCKQILLANMPKFFFVNKFIKDVFAERKPYEYLQLCYYRNGDMLKAASATFTSLIINQKSAMMLRNLEYYAKAIEHFNRTMLIDYEEKRFAQFYIAGLRAYAQENWQLVIENIEGSLQQFIYDLDECRAFCEGEFDQGWHIDFTSSIANHFTYSLRCKQNCTHHLSFIRGQFYENIFQTHYEYLQIAYFNQQQLKDACRAATSYILLNPSSKEMHENIEFYKTQPNVDASTYFTPRNEAKRFNDIQRYERRILQFINEEFTNDQL